MKLIIDGTHEQIVNTLKKLECGLAVYDSAKDEYHINLDAGGHSCVTEFVHVAELPPPSCDGSDLVVSKHRSPIATKKEVAPPKKIKITVKDVSKICPICEDAFTPHHGRQVYCDKCIKEYGGKCNVVAKRKRKNSVKFMSAERGPHDQGKAKPEPKNDAVSEDD